MIKIQMIIGETAVFLLQEEDQFGVPNIIREIVLFITKEKP